MFLNMILGVLLGKRCLPGRQDSQRGRAQLGLHVRAEKAGSHPPGRGLGGRWASQVETGPRAKATAGSGGLHLGGARRCCLHPRFILGDVLPSFAL